MAEVFGRNFPDLVDAVRADLAGVVGGQLEMNTLTARATIDRRPITDVDCVNVRYRAGKRLYTVKPVKDSFQPVFGDWSPKDVSAALNLVANERPYNPLVEELRRVAWDQQPRLLRFLREVLRSPASGALHDVLARGVRAWFIGAVARAVQPGIKHDVTLLLMGLQDAGKGQLVKALAGNADYCASLKGDIRSKDSILAVEGRWLVELEELTFLDSASIEATKGFLTATYDDVRRPYAEYPVRIQRACAFIGSTNKDAPLPADPSGHRRWMPVSVGTQIDLELARAWRDQLWAEALAAFDAGERWWEITDDDRRVLNEHRARYEAGGDAADLYADAVIDLVVPACLAPDGSVRGLTLVEVMTVINVPPHLHHDRRTQLAVGAALRRAGFAPLQQRGEKGRSNRWTPPDELVASCRHAPPPPATAPHSRRVVAAAGIVGVMADAAALTRKRGSS